MRPIKEKVNPKSESKQFGSAGSAFGPPISVGRIEALEVIHELLKSLGCSTSFKVSDFESDDVQALPQNPPLHLPCPSETYDNPPPPWRNANNVSIEDYQDVGPHDGLQDEEPLGPADTGSPSNEQPPPNDYSEIPFGDDLLLPPCKKWTSEVVLGTFSDHNHMEKFRLSFNKLIPPDAVGQMECCMTLKYEYSKPGVSDLFAKRKPEIHVIHIGEPFGGHWAAVVYLPSKDLSKSTVLYVDSYKTIELDMKGINIKESSNLDFLFIPAEARKIIASLYPSVPVSQWVVPPVEQQMPYEVSCGPRAMVNSLHYLSHFSKHQGRQFVCARTSWEYLRTSHFDAAWLSRSNEIMQQFLNFFHLSDGLINQKAIEEVLKLSTDVFHIEYLRIQYKRVFTGSHVVDSDDVVFLKFPFCDLVAFVVCPY